MSKKHSNEKTCRIFGAGEYYGLLPTLPPDDFVIAADGGYSYLAAHGIQADIVIGDFDSLDLPPTGENVITLPKDKDDTDMLAAIKAGISRGFNTLYIYGGTGGRIDHTLANIQCVAYLAQLGYRGYLMGSDTAITAIHNGSIAFSATASGTISIFSHSNVAEGVSITGLKFSVSNVTLSNTFPIGVSNEFVGEESKIEVTSGTLIITYPINERKIHHEKST